jgi:putative MATE family efflux protein
MMVFIGIYTIVDTIFVARFVNALGLSTMTICAPVIYATVGLASMLATGGSAIIGRKMGAGDDEGAHKTFSMIIVAGIALSAIIMAVGLPLHEPLLRTLGATDELMAQCKSYLVIMLSFTFANMLSVLFQVSFIVAGRPTIGFTLGIIAGLLNILLDYIFIVPLQMGVAGAALATSLGYLSVTIAGLIFFSKRGGVLHFVRPALKWRELLESCINGSSEMVSLLSTAVTTFLFNKIMLELIGVDGVAAVAVMLFSQFLFTSIYIGFSIGVAPLFSYAYGSNDSDRLRKLLSMSLGFIAIASVTLFAVAMLFGRDIAQIFAPTTPSVYKLVAACFTIFPISFLFSGFNIFTSALFTALSNGKVSALLSFLRTLVFIVVALKALPELFSILGVWLAVPAAEFCTLILAIVLIIRLGRSHS